MNDVPYIQLAVNLGATLCEIGYLIYYMPFKEKHIFISAISGEICTAYFIVMSVFFLGSISEGTSSIIEKSMIYSVLATMIIQFLVSIYSLILEFKRLWKKMVKHKALAFLKAAKNFQNSNCFVDHIGDT